MIDKYLIIRFTEKCIEKLELENATLGEPGDNPLENEYNYNGLALCLIDAVFSIGVKYSGVRKAIKKYAERAGVRPYKVPGCGKEHTVSDFILLYDKVGKTEMATNYLNRQRTSSRNGIMKVEASYKVANILNEYGIDTIKDFRKKSNKDLDEKILGVKGQSSGIMLHYLYMLAGDENTCKPDRMVCRFLCENVDSNRWHENKLTKESILEIEELFRLSIDEFKHRGFSDMNVRLLDNQIWKYQKGKK